MRMLLVCPHFRKIEYGVTESFRRLGIEVYPLYFNVGMDSYHYFQRLKNKLGYNIEEFLQKQKKQFNLKLMDKFQSIQPDIVYVIQGRWMASETIREIRKSSFIALYLWDMVSLFPEMIETFKEYNVIYSFDRKDAEYLVKEGYNAKFKVSGYDNSVYYPIECEIKYDIAFIGAMYQERIELLKRLVKEFPDIEWAIYGEYAPLRMPLKWIKWRFSSEYKYFRNKNISKTQVNQIYNESKIVLSIVRENQEDGWSARLPEILGTQTFQITNYFPIVENEFNNCLCTYKDKQELISKIRYYLSHDEEREKIAHNGYVKVKELYSDDQLNRMIIHDYEDWRKQKQ